MPESSKNSSPRVAESMKAAIELSGYKIEELKRAKKAGCPAFRGARVYLDELDEWLGNNSHVLQRTPEERLDFETKAVKRAQAQFEYDLKRGDYIHRGELCDHLRKTEESKKKILRRALFNEFPAKGEFLDRAALRELAEETFVEICELTQEALGKWIGD